MQESLGIEIERAFHPLISNKLCWLFDQNLGGNAINHKIIFHKIILKIRWCAHKSDFVPNCGGFWVKWAVFDAHWNESHISETNPRIFLTWFQPHLTMLSTAQLWTWCKSQEPSSSLWTQGRFSRSYLRLFTLFLHIFVYFIHFFTSTLSYSHWSGEWFRLRRPDTKRAGHWLGLRAVSRTRCTMFLTFHVTNGRMRFTKMLFLKQ